MQELANLLLQNALIDFEGSFDPEKVRQMLRDDGSQPARALLTKLMDDQGVDDLLVAVADCLREHIPTGITAETIAHQLGSYSES